MLSKAGIRELHRYAGKKHRIEQGRLLVEGWRSLAAAAEAGAAIEWLLISEDVDEHGWPKGLIEKLSDGVERVDRIPGAQMKSVSLSVTPPGLAGLVAWRPAGAEELLEGLSVAPDDTGPRIVVVADVVTDPGNLGTVIRTADWFGVRGVFAGSGSVELTNPKLVQSTMGSLFQVPVGGGGPAVSLLEGLKGVGFTIVSLELDGAKDVREMEWPDKLALVIGNEARGVSPDVSRMADQRVRIPRFGRAESLNAAVSVAAVLSLVRL
jgi:TrmH family RNA methyltransferase